MSDKERSGKVTQGERMMAQVLRWAPWLAFLLCALPLPIYFLTKYFSSVPEAALNFLFALTSLAVGSVVGFGVMLFLLYYRRNWAQRVRDRIAADGVTAEEIPWFMSELTPSERQALKDIETKNAMLADAYRETLASRITASRVIANAKRELLLVERRLNKVIYIQGADTTSLQQELRTDRERLEQIKTEGTERRAEAEARLHMIEAAASRGSSWAETNMALHRLSTTHEQMPLALEAARMEQQALEESEKALRETQASTTKELGVDERGQAH